MPGVYGVLKTHARLRIRHSPADPLSEQGRASGLGDITVTDVHMASASVRTRNVTRRDHGVVSLYWATCRLGGGSPPPANPLREHAPDVGDITVTDAHTPAMYDPSGWRPSARGVRTGRRLIRQSATPLCEHAPCERTATYPTRRLLGAGFFQRGLRLFSGRSGEFSCTCLRIQDHILQDATQCGICCLPPVWREDVGARYQTL